MSLVHSDMEGDWGEEHLCCNVLALRLSHSHTVEVGQKLFVWMGCLAKLDTWTAFDRTLLLCRLVFTSETKPPCVLVLQSTSPHAVHGLMN